MLLDWFGCGKRSVVGGAGIPSRILPEATIPQARCCRVNTIFGRYVRVAALQEKSMTTSRATVRDTQLVYETSPAGRFVVPELGQTGLRVGVEVEPRQNADPKTMGEDWLKSYIQLQPGFKHVCHRDQDVSVQFVSVA
jgi:hypothetical protein